MKQIPVITSNSDNFLQQFGALYAAFKGIKQNEQVQFDLSGANWLCPIVILPISAYIAKTSSTFVTSNNPTISGYLNTIDFPNGVHSATAFEKATHERKTYVPISVLERDKGSEREHLESMFSRLVYRLLGSVPGAQNAVYYPITELVTNIFEHSGDEAGFVFGQYYTSRKYLDVCIVDIGRGLAAGYKDRMKLELTDGQAIEEVLKGNSTKSNQERGYGIRTSKRVVCEGLGGQFIIISGSSALVSTQSSEKLVSLPDFYWQGVIVSYRIPKPKDGIDITSYLE